MLDPPEGLSAAIQIAVCGRNKCSVFEHREHQHADGSGWGDVADQAHLRGGALDRLGGHIGNRWADPGFRPYSG